MRGLSPIHALCVTATATAAAAPSPSPSPPCTPPHPHPPAPAAPAPAPAPPPFTLVAWANCGFCTKAREELDARGVAYAHHVVDRYSAEHAELAMATGRCSVPYVFSASGVLLGGFEADGELPGLAGALAAMEAQGAPM